MGSEGQSSSFTLQVFSLGLWLSSVHTYERMYVRIYHLSIHLAIHLSSLIHLSVHPSVHLSSSSSVGFVSLENLSNTVVKAQYLFL